MSTHKEEPKDKYIEARKKVLGILIDEYKQNCNYDALMRIMSVVEEYGGTLEPKEECDTSCGINADPADGFGKCTCGVERVEPTPPSQDPLEELQQTEPKFKIGDRVDTEFGSGEVVDFSRLREEYSGWGYVVWFKPGTARVVPKVFAEWQLELAEPKQSGRWKPEGKAPEFKKKLESLINSESIDNYFGIPDFILVEHIWESVLNLASTTEALKGWHGWGEEDTTEVKEL